jgi:hypothetical protein
MFLCKECHKEDEEKYGCLFDLHWSKSYGKCEICGKVTDCVDCKSYKGRRQ